MFRRGGIRFVVALALLAAFASPTCALAAGLGSSRGPADWLDWDDLRVQAQRWLSALLPRIGGADGGKAGSSIDPNGKPGTGETGGSGSGTATNSEGGDYDPQSVP